MCVYKSNGNVIYSFVVHDFNRKEIRKCFSFESNYHHIQYSRISFVLVYFQSNSISTVHSSSIFPLNLFQYWWEICCMHLMMLNRSEQTKKIQMTTSNPFKLLSFTFELYLLSMKLKNFLN